MRAAPRDPKPARQLRLGRSCRRRRPRFSARRHFFQKDSASAEPSRCTVPSPGCSQFWRQPCAGRTHRSAAAEQHFSVALCAFFRLKFRIAERLFPSTQGSPFIFSSRLRLPARPLSLVGARCSCVAKRRGSFIFKLSNKPPCSFFSIFSTFRLSLSNSLRSLYRRETVPLPCHRRGHP